MAANHKILQVVVSEEELRTIQARAEELNVSGSLLCWATICHASDNLRDFSQVPLDTFIRPENSRPTRRRKRSQGAPS